MSAKRQNSRGSGQPVLPNMKPRGGKSLMLAMFGAFVAVLGLALAFLSFVKPLQGFVTVAVGLLLCLLSVPTSIGAIFGSLQRDSRGGWWRGLISLSITGLTAWAIVTPALEGMEYPRINDITTDTRNPPTFVHAQKLDGNAGRDLSYPGESFARKQMLAYADVRSIVVAASPEETFDRVRVQLTRPRGVQITYENRGEGRIEATATSGWFRFVDDIVVRIEPAGTGARIDVRSKSRDGKSDLGANAARIRELLAALDS